MTAAVSDKATIAQVAEVEAQIPDVSNLATKTEVEAGDASVLNNVLGKMWNKGSDCFYTKKTVNGKTAIVFNEEDGGGSIYETSDLKSFVGVNDGGDVSTGVHVQIYSKSKADNKGARLNVNPTGIFYGVGTSAEITPEKELAVKGDIPSIKGLATTEQLNDAVEVVNVELDKKADTVDVSTAVESIETSLETKADADTVYTKEVCDNKFLTEHQDLSEYAKTVDVSDGYVPIGEYNALVDKVKVLSAYIDSFVTVDPKKREEANDTIIESLSDDNTSVVVPSEIKSIVYPETTKGLTVVAPLADDSSVQITSEKYFYLDNTSETGNTSTAITGIDSATSATTCYLTGTFDTLTLTNISVSKSSSKNAAVVSNVVIPDTNETNISLSVVLTEGATITNNSDKDVTITNQSGGETAQPTVYVVAPNSTVTVSGGQYGTFESTVGDNTLYISKSTHINKLIVKKGNVIVNDYEVESHIDEIENDTEYTVTPKTIEVTS